MLEQAYKLWPIGSWTQAQGPRLTPQRGRLKSKFQQIMSSTQQIMKSLAANALQVINSNSYNSTAIRVN